MVASLALAGVQTVRMDHAKEAAAESKLEFADFKTSIANQNLKLVQDQQARETKVFDQLTSALKTLGEVGKQTTTEVRLVQSNGGACAQDPAYLAMLDGVQRVQLAAQRGSGSDQAKGGSKAPVPLQPTGKAVTR